jgi:hypothetical protein
MTLTLWWGINIALTALIIRWARTIDKRMRALKKYEFEHRTDGGVVQFSSFEASEEHNRQKRAAQLAQGGPAGLSFIVFLSACAGAFYQFVYLPNSGH